MESKLVGVQSIPIDPTWQIELVDLFDPVHSRAERESLFAQVSQVHSKHFESYGFVLDQWRVLLEGSGFPDQVIKHVWVAFRDGQACGEFVIDINLNRETILVHFVAMDKEVRRSLPELWLKELIGLLVNFSQEEARVRGVELRAVMAESYDEYIWKWDQLGHIALPIGYQEPAFGAQWREHGSEPDFHDITATVLVLTDSKEEDYEWEQLRPIKAQRATNAVRAFLLDAYDLPPENSVVARILERSLNSEIV
jgi:hypothetical protein